MHLTFFANDLIDYALRGDGWDYAVPATLVGLSLIGVIVHSMEPGFLTKDKQQTRGTNKQQ